MIRNPTEPIFWDKQDLRTEIDRVFDVCHQCRMCFNLCPSFPTLFKHVDEHDGEVRTLSEEEIAEVTDLCYQCKICYVKCPYTPPHHWDLDFPRLLLREKAVRVKEQGAAFQDRYLGDPDRTGKLGCHFAPVANFANRQSLFRKILSWTVGVHEERKLPDFAEETFQQWFQKRPHPLKSDNKVAFFHSCFVNYYSVNQGIAAVEVLEKNGFEVLVPEQICCGMPFLDGGEVEKAISNMKSNVRTFSEFITAGIPIVSIGPTCTYVLKNEFAYFTQDPAAGKMSESTKDLCEFLMELKGKGQLNTDFVMTPAKTISYQIPCHLRAQNMGYKSMDLLRTIPNVRVKLVEQCSAMDGTWGMKKQFYELSLKMAGKLFREIKESPAEIVCTDCPLSAIQIEQGTKNVPVHPIEILHHAYGLGG